LTILYSLLQGYFHMFSSSTLLVFALAALGLLLLPGPAVLYISTRSITQGRRAGLASVLGIELASLVHSAAAALGLSAILMTSALAFNGLKYIGAAYLLYLGVRTIISQTKKPIAEKMITNSFFQLVAKGFLVNLLNPKTALFFYAFLPQFVDPARGVPVYQILFLGAMFVLLATCTDSSYALLSSSAGKVLVRSTRFQRMQRYIAGGIYITLGLATIVSGNIKK
jgi:threonine/homoserine/homoserine lactone efflux protein